MVRDSSLYIKYIYAVESENSSTDLCSNSHFIYEMTSLCSSSHSPSTIGPMATVGAIPMPIYGYNLKSFRNVVRTSFLNQNDHY